MVRAKFKVNSITRRLMHCYEKDAEGKNVTVAKEIWSINMSPVFANGDPNHENSKFWSATPTGEITLGCVNADAVRQFDLDKEYYVDFTPAE